MGAANDKLSALLFNADKEVIPIISATLKNCFRKKLRYLKTNRIDIMPTALITVIIFLFLPSSVRDRRKPAIKEAAVMIRSQIIERGFHEA